jgi:hypothetical protein
MTLAELLFSQLLDPFRIGLLLALVVTAYNTAGTVGIAVPLILGAAFVAVLIPVSMPQEGIDRTTAILTGVAANAILVGVIMAGRAAWTHFTASGRE